MSDWLDWLGDGGGWRAGLVVLAWRWAELTVAAALIAWWRRRVAREQAVRPRPVWALAVPIVGLIWWFPVGRLASDYMAEGDAGRLRARRLAMAYGLIGLATAVPVARLVAWPTGLAVMGAWLWVARPRSTG